MGTTQYSENPTSLEDMEEVIIPKETESGKISVEEIE